MAKHEPDKAEIDESEMEELIEKHKAMKLNEKGAFSSAGEGGLGNDDESESDADFHESDVDEMDDDDNEEMKAGDKKGKKTMKTSKSMQDKGLNKQKKDSEMIEDDEGSDDSENGHAQVDMAKMSGDSRLMEELKMGDSITSPRV